MNPSFSFDVDVPRSLVRMTLGGFFGIEDIDRFVAARDVAHRKLRCPRNAHMTLADIRAIKIQSQGSVAGFSAVLADPASKSRRIAFVVDTSLARMQLKRAAGSRGDEIFLTPDEAEHWLFAQDAAATA